LKKEDSRSEKVFQQRGIKRKESRLVLPTLNAAKKKKKEESSSFKKGGRGGEEKPFCPELSPRKKPGYRRGEKKRLGSQKKGKGGIEEFVPKI